MRALSVGGPRSLTIQEVADPRPGAGEVLVSIEACGVCGSDLNAWHGVPGIEYPLKPGAPGHEAIGKVVELGAEVRDLRIGDRVTGLMWNAFAELGTAREEHLVVVPGPFAERLLLGEPLACAMNVVRRAAIRDGDRVAIVGFGYLAAMVAQLLPANVAEWIAVSRRPDSRELALRLGAAAAYDFGHVEPDRWDHFPVVIEAAGVQQTLDFATWLTAYSGRLVIAGYHADGPRTVNMQSWNWKGIDVINAHERRPDAYLRGLHAAFERIDPHTWQALLTHAWPLDRAAEAFAAAETRPTGFVKGIVTP